MSFICSCNIGINVVRFMQVSYHSGDVVFRYLALVDTQIDKRVFLFVSFKKHFFKELLMTEPFELSYDK